MSSIIEIDSADSQVFNIGVADDESYVASGYIVHNCRSHVRGLSSEEAHRRGVTWWYPEPRAEPGWGVLDEEYLPAPDGVPQELWDVFQRAISDE